MVCQQNIGIDKSYVLIIRDLTVRTTSRHSDAIHLVSNNFIYKTDLVHFPFSTLRCILQTLYTILITVIWDIFHQQSQLKKV